MSHQSFVESVLCAWLELAPELLPLVIAMNIKRLPDGSKATIEVETSRYVALIEVWEHAACLDTTVLRIDTKEDKALAAGSCNGQQEVLERLRALRDVLLGHNA